MDSNQIKKYLTCAALLWLAGAGLFVRTRGLSAYHYSPDEVLDLWMCGRPTLAATWQMAREQPHPPIRYLIQRGMLKVSRSPLFLRSFSLAPGVILIFVFFALGRRVSGTASGLTMAALAAFGFGPVLTSEVARVYPLAAVLQSAALYCWVGFLDDRRPRQLAGLGLFASLAFLSIYIQAIAIAAVFVAWLLFIVARRKPVRAWLGPAWAAVPVAAAVVFIYFIHGRYFFRTARFSSPAEGWIAPFFFSDWRGFLANLYDLFGYVSLPPVAAPALLLTAVGLTILWRRSRPEVALAFAVALGLQFAVTWAGRFPFGGTRHSLHLFPFIALAVGAAAQAGYDRAMKEADRRGWGETFRRPAAALVAFIGLATATAGLVGYYSGSDYLRRYSPASWRELPVKESEFAAAASHFSEVRPGDLVFASYQTVLYLELETGQEWSPVSQNLGRLNYRGIDWFFVTRDGAASDWGMPGPEELREALSGLAVTRRLRPEARAWVFNIGWIGKVDWMTTDPFWSAHARTVMDDPGAAVYEMPARELLGG